MWGDVSHHQLPPDSEEELRVVYGDGGGGLAAEAAAEAEEAAVRGGRVRLCLLLKDAPCGQRFERTPLGQR